MPTLCRPPTLPPSPLSPAAPKTASSAPTPRPAPPRAARAPRCRTQMACSIAGAPDLCRASGQAACTAAVTRVPSAQLSPTPTCFPVLTAARATRPVWGRTTPSAARLPRSTAAATSAERAQGCGPAAMRSWQPGLPGQELARAGCLGGRQGPRCRNALTHLLARTLPTPQTAIRCLLNGAQCSSSSDCTNSCCGKVGIQEQVTFQRYCV